MPIQRLELDLNEYRNPNYFTAWRRAFDFLGDSTRTEYWTFTLINIVIGLVLGLGFVATGGDAGGVGLLFVLLAGVFFLAQIIPGISVTIRRVRDATGTGLWTLLIFVPLVGGLIILVITLMPTSSR